MLSTSTLTSPADPALHPISSSPQDHPDSSEASDPIRASNSTTAGIPISSSSSSSISHHHLPQSVNPILNLASQLSPPGLAPCSLPTYIGSWDSHPDLPNFGSVPSSPAHVFGLERDLSLESQFALSHPSSSSFADHHPPHPLFTSTSSTNTNDPIRYNQPPAFNHSSGSTDHQIRTFQAKPSHGYLTGHDPQHHSKSEAFQLAIPASHPSSNLHRQPPDSFRSITSHRSISDGSILSTFLADHSNSHPPSLSTPATTAEGSGSHSISDFDHHSPLHRQSLISDSKNFCQPPSRQAASRWQPSSLPLTDNTHQPIRKLTKDAIYVSSTGINNSLNKPSIDWPNYNTTTERSVCLSLREPSSALGSPPSAKLSPYTPSSPYSPWSSFSQADDISTNSQHRLVTHLGNGDQLAAKLWQLYGPGDQGPPTNDALESLIRRLAELGLDVDQIRKQLNSDEWKDGSIQNNLSSSRTPINTSGTSESSNSQAKCTEPLPGSSNELGPSHLSHNNRASVVSKIYENAEQSVSKVEYRKTALSTRESSLERGRKSGLARRVGCNLAGRWQESANLSPSSGISEMDWSAHSRSRSRTHAGKFSDWRQASRSSSRVPELRYDLFNVGNFSESLSDLSSLNNAHRHRPSNLNPAASQSHPLGIFPELGSFQSGTGSINTDETSHSEAYQHGLIQQLIGSYQAQQCEENGLQSLSEKNTEHSNLWPTGPPHLSGGFFQSSSMIPLSEFELGSRHHPIKPSQHSLLGSIPGLTQDFANLANAHAEYGYIPRLVRKTSFDEILAQRNQKRTVDSEDRVPSRLENHSSSTADSLTRPNTATDLRQPPYRLGLNTSGLEQNLLEQPQMSAPVQSRDQIDFFELLDPAYCGYGSSPFSLKPEDNLHSSQFRQSPKSDRPLLQTDRSSIVDNMAPYDILTQINRLDNSSATPTATGQWLQGSVAPTAIQSVIAELKGTEGTSSAHSPTDSSNSSELSHHSGLAIQIQTANSRHNHIKQEPTSETMRPTISFSGGKSNHMSSIGEARKRTKQLPYSSGEAGNTSNSTSVSANGGQAVPVIQCLNCQTTETPLWRRDPEGKPLCNACGLFINLHGTPRPAALSTGIIKRRNRGKNKERVTRGVKGNPLDPNNTSLQTLAASKFNLGIPHLERRPEEIKSECGSSDSVNVTDT